MSISTTETPDLDAVWLKLAKTTTSGVHRLRLHPVLDFNATHENPGGRIGLFLRTKEILRFEKSELVGSEQVAIEVLADESGTLIALTLLQENSREMFLQLCSDIVPRVISQGSERAAGTTLVRRFNAWQRFLKRSSGRGLSGEQQLGLYGELTTLVDLLFGNIDFTKAVEAWTGPSRAPQDFQIDGIAIEVKTVVHSEPQSFRIDGEKQLDDFGLEALVLAHHRVFRHQDSGETLPDLVSRVRMVLNREDAQADAFEDRLLDAGYSDVDADKYTKIGYSVKDTTYYRVQPGFPRITESDLPIGVGRVEYTITADACSRFITGVDSIIRWLSEPPTVVDPSVVTESYQVEYKQTAWTPVGAIENAEHRKKIVHELKTSIVKTVVAFLNSDGGELVIGVRDKDRSVSGVEADLTEKRLPADDFDKYEQEIVSLLSDRIDRLVTSQIRIRFEHHESGTTCHLTVRPSPSPRFGYAPRAINERRRPVFWIRTGNTTREIEGADLVEYLAHRWG